MLTNAVLGTKFKIVPGYASTPQMNEALERGEVEGIVGFGWFALNAQMPQWVAQKKIKMIAQFGVTRSRLLPDVPLMLDLAKTPKPTARRCSCCSAAPNTAGPISCRPTCRRIASKRCAAPSTRP